MGEGKSFLSLKANFLRLESPLTRPGRLSREFLLHPRLSPPSFLCFTAQILPCRRGPLRNVYVKTHFTVSIVDDLAITVNIFIQFLSPQIWEDKRA